LAMHFKNPMDFSWAISNPEHHGLAAFLTMSLASRSLNFPILEMGIIQESLPPRLAAD
jgi:hypothetical protein